MKSLSLKIKLKIILIAALAMSFVLSLAALFGDGTAHADRGVIVDGIKNTNILSLTDAEMRAHKEGDEYYLMPVINSADGSVNFKKNLAYEWYYNSAETEDSSKVPETMTKAIRHFNMEIGFEKLSFEKFVLAFESQQYLQTKDDKTTNYIFFTPSKTESGKVEVRVSLKNPDEEKWDEAYDRVENLCILPADHIKIAFSKDENTEEGCYDVIISSGDLSYKSKFENVGGTFSKYSSSTTKPVTPISFRADFAENAENPSAPVTIYCINDQLFRVGTFASATITTEEQANISKYYKKDDYRYVKVGADESYDAEEKYYSYNAGVIENGEGENKYYTLGGSSSINDDTKPVICLNKGITYIKEGEEISFDYTVIDVLQSPTVYTNYFMLTTDQKGNVDPDDLDADNLYREVRDSDDQKMIVHYTHYVPTSADYKATSAFGKDFTAKGAVKVYLRVTDSYSGSSYIFLDWYVEDKYLLNIDDKNYIAVANDEKGVSYGYTADGASNPNSDEWAKTVEDYQEEVTAAAERQELKAGTKNYFYLPSVKSLLSDDITAYNDLRFSIYFKTDSDSATSGQTNTGKSASELSINISKAGKYVFTVYATDAAGNNMYYYDKDGELKEFPASDIWNMRVGEKGTDFEGLSDYLPWFEFTVRNTELTIKDPGEQSTAYVGTTYKASSFEINGVDYKSVYTLYRFNSEKYYSETGESMTYEKFMAEKEQLFKEHGDDWFIKIYALKDMQETDSEYDVYSDYAWNPDDLSFVPQGANSFYLIECVSTNTDNGRQTASSYMGISASTRVKSIKGEDTWLKDNMTSIVLLCIAGLSLIGIILLLVIKPKDKGDIDEVLANGGKSNKKKKS